jgi:hypothetical protein
MFGKTFPSRGQWAIRYGDRGTERDARLSPWHFDREQAGREACGVIDQRRLQLDELDGCEARSLLERFE